MKELEMSDLRNLPYFLSMKLLRTDRGMVMHQKKYVMEVLKRFKVLKSNPAAFPIKSNLKLEKNGDEDKVDATLFKQIVGSLRYVRNSRPDIGFSVGLVSRYMDDLRVSHMQVTRRIFRYLKGTLNYGILFPRSLDVNNVMITCYSYANWCGYELDQRSTTGYFFQVFGAPISWCFRKQPVVALSSCEAEHILGSYATCQAIWIK